MAISPSNIKQIEYNGSNIEVFQMDMIPEFDIEEYNLNDEKDLEKYLKDIENEVRKSYENIEYIKYLREFMDMNKCSFFENITNIQSTKIKIHIHHSPITLYEIVTIILEKRRFYGEPLDPELVAKEVMYTHYCLLIGLIPLCETVHTLVHNGYLFVPNDKVLGKYEDFMRMYDQWIPWQLKEKYQRLQDYTRTYNEAVNSGILEPHYIYLDLEGTYKLPEMDQILKALEGRMEYLRNNNYSIKPAPKPLIIWDNK